MTNDEFLPALNDMVRQLKDVQDEAQTLERVLKLSLDNIAGCDSASITLTPCREKARTPCATGELARRGDELQYELNEGPCLAAADDQLVIYAGDVANDPRWPVWGPKVASELDVHSMLCLQLFTRGRDYGALNLYSHARYAFSHEAQLEAEALASMAAATIAARREIEGLQSAVVSRTLIGQAQGILMERYQIDAEQAFAFLTRLSSTQERPVRQVAEDIIQTRRVPEAPPRYRSPDASS